MKKATIQTAAKMLQTQGLVLGLSHHDLQAGQTFYTVTDLATGEKKTLAASEIVELVS